MKINENEIFLKQVGNEYVHARIHSNSIEETVCIVNEYSRDAGRGEVDGRKRLKGRVGADGAMETVAEGAASGDDVATEGLGGSDAAVVVVARLTPFTLFEFVACRFRIGPIRSKYRYHLQYSS